MMDYSEESSGCCLHCDAAAPGCLCVRCKCTKCEQYEKARSGGGYCSIAYGFSKDCVIERVIASTPKALLCKVTNIDGEHWIPISQTRGIRIRHFIVDKILVDSLILHGRTTKKKTTGGAHTRPMF